MSVETLIKRSCHNLRSNSEIEMKLGQLRKIFKRNTVKLLRETRRYQQKSDNDILLASYDVIVIFQIFLEGGFRADAI